MSAEKPWKVQKYDDGQVHVWPLDDLREHWPEGQCWCLPSPLPDKPAIMVHHALDGRAVQELN